MNGLVLAVADGSRDPGPLALLIILLLGVATVLLLRSLNRHLKRVPRSFDQHERPEPPDERGPGHSSGR